MPLLEIGCFYLSSALPAKLPAVHPALPRNSVGYVFWSGCKHTLVGQSGNLDQVTLVCQLMIVESSWGRCAEIIIWRIGMPWWGHGIVRNHLGKALLGGPGVGFSVRMVGTQPMC